MSWSAAMYRPSRGEASLASVAVGYGAVRFKTKLCGNASLSGYRRFLQLTTFAMSRSLPSLPFNMCQPFAVFATSAFSLLLWPAFPPSSPLWPSCCQWLLGGDERRIVEALVGGFIAGPRGQPRVQSIYHFLDGWHFHDPLVSFEQLGVNIWFPHCEVWSAYCIIVAGFILCSN